MPSLFAATHCRSCGKPHDLYVQERPDVSLGRLYHFVCSRRHRVTTFRARSAPRWVGACPSEAIALTPIGGS
jgi:hypothetical protein